MTKQQTATTDRVPIRRTTEIEEITNLYFIHPLAARLVPLFARLRITPNAVSIMGMLFGILAACAYYRYADVRFAVAGFLLMIIWHVMDGADGQLARFTQTYSYAGKMLDGISDNVTFLAIYVALAIAMSHRLGNGIYVLVAVSGLCHAIQSASYESQRQEYETLGRGKKPQGPTPSAGPARDRTGSPLNRVLDFLHELWFSGLSFPTAAITRKFRATMAAALQQDPATEPWVREQYRETVAPRIRQWSILSANYRTLGIFLFALFQAPQYYFAFEIVGFGLVLAVLVWRQSGAHRDLVQRLQRAPTARSAARESV